MAALERIADALERIADALEQRKDGFTREPLPRCTSCGKEGHWTFTCPSTVAANRKRPYLPY